MKYLYLHLRKDNKTPFYVGVGDVKRPYNFNVRNDIWKNEHKKHGCEVIIIEKSNDYSYLYNREIELIKHYGRIINNSGVLSNISTGGMGSCGVKYSAEEIEKRRLRMLNYVPSEQTRIKMSLARKGKKLSEETRKKISESHKKRTDFHSGFGKRVVDLETGIFYGNIRLACEALNLNPLSIQKKIIRGNYKRLSYE